MVLILRLFVAVDKMSESHDLKGQLIEVVMRGDIGKIGRLTEQEGVDTNCRDVSVCC